MEMKTHKIRDTIFLFLTAMIWGAAFVAQSVSMDYIGPFTFICLRSVIGGLFLIPVIMVIDNIRKKRRSESVKTASDNGINSFQKMQAAALSTSLSLCAWRLPAGLPCGGYSSAWAVRWEAFLPRGTLAFCAETGTTASR